MKKITLTLAIALGVSSLFAQDKKVMGKIVIMYSQKKFENAKTEIDKLIADPTNATSPELWMWKSTVDAEFLNSEELKAKCADCLNSSFDAFKKYEALESNLKTASEAPFTWRSLGILYDKFYSLAVTQYNDKNFVAASETLDKVAYFSKIITKKDLKKNGGGLDTLPMRLAAGAAEQAKDIKKALYYYSIIADAKYGGADDINMYKFILYNYSDLKDKANFEKYFAIAQEKYPNENLDDYKLDFISKNLSLDEKVALFDSEDAKGTLSAGAYMNYGDMFINLKKDEKAAVETNAAKRTMLHTKGREAFRKAYTKNNDVLAGFNVGVLYFNEFNDLDDQRNENVKAMQALNTNKVVEKDPKKKAAADAKLKEQLDAIRKTNAEIETKIEIAADNAIEWLEKTFNTLKDKTDKSKTEKSSYKNDVKFLGALCEHKREKAKAKNSKVYDEFDAKSKKYYEIYDKL